MHMGGASQAVVSVDKSRSGELLLAFFEQLIFAQHMYFLTRHQAQKMSEDPKFILHQASRLGDGKAALFWF